MNRRCFWRRALGKVLVCGLTGLLAPAVAHAMTEAKLANGLRFLYEERPASGLVAAAVLVGAGAAHETAANNGAAHFLEHLLFSGTTSRTQEQLEHDVELIGAYSNATTQRDHVAYLMVVGSEDLERALSIQADMLFHSTLPADRVEKERGIIREEIGKETSDPSFPADRLLAQLLAGSEDEHAALPVLGTPTSIAALSRDQIQEYYQRYYVPGNMTLIVLGEFAPERLVAMVERHFAGAPAGVAPVDAAPDSAPAGIFLRPGAGDRRFLRLRLPAGPPATAPLPALVLVEELLNGEAGGLARALRVEPRIEGPASAVLELAADRAWLEIGAECDTTAQVEAVAERLLGAVRALTNAIDPVDLEAARSRREVAAALAGDEIHYVAFTRADWIRHAPLAVWANEPEALAAVDERAIAAAAGGLLAGKEAVLAAVGSGLPAKDDPRNPLTAVSSPAVGGADTALTVRRERAHATRRETFYLTDVAWNRVAARQAPIERTFPNGLTAIVTAAPESEVFAIQLCARGRTFCEPGGKSGVADLLHRMLLHGAGGRSEEYLGRQLDLAGIRLKLTDDPRIPYDDYQTHQAYSFIRLETVDRYGTHAIHLLSEMVQAPELQQEAFSEVKRQAVLEAERRASSPSDQSQMLLRQQLYGTSPGARPALGTVADLRGLTIDDLRAFHAHYFAPSNLILAVATGIEPEAVLAYIGAALGGEPGGAGPTVVPPAPCAQPSAMQPPATQAPGRREQLLAKDQSWIRLGTVLASKPADLPALEVASLVLSDRMSAELREQRGLAYSVGASLARAGDRAWLVAGMGTRPDSVAAAEAGLIGEIRDLGKSKISADEVTRVVKTYQGRQRMRRLTRINQAQALALDALAGHPPGAAEQSLMALSRVSPADVERAARTYFTPAPLVTAIAR